MAVLRRSAAGPRLRLAEHEARLLAHLFDMLEAALTERERADPDSPGDVGGPGPDDLLAELTGMAAGDGAPPDDPVLRRLLPDAYRDDDEAAAEFRRYTERELRDGKVADLAAVRETLRAFDAADRPRWVTLDDEHVQAWLRALTDVRLMLGSLLGFETDDDPVALDAAIRSGTVEDGVRVVGELFDWLGELLGDLIDTIG